MDTKNIKCNERNILYIYIHVFKCAGSTLKYHIQNNFDDSEILLLYGDRKRKLKTRKDVGKLLNSIPKSKKNQIRIIFGHKVFYGIHKFFKGRKVRYILLLRNPITRTISHYNYERMAAEGLRSEITKNMVSGFKKLYMPHGKVLNFFEWFSKTDKSFENYLTKYLYIRFNSRYSVFSKDYYTKKLDIDNIIFKNIKKILDNFYFVGVTENEYDVLFILYLFRVNKYFSNKNISTKYFSKFNSNNTKHLILSKNNYDKKLYNYVLKLNKKFRNMHRSVFIVVKFLKIKRYILIYYLNYLRFLYGISFKLRKKSKSYSNFLDFIKGVK